MPRATLAPTVSALALALVLAPLTPAAAAPEETGSAPSTQQVLAEQPSTLPEAAKTTDRVIVKYKDDATAQAAPVEELVQEAAEVADVPEATEATQVNTVVDGATVVELAEETSTEKVEKLAQEISQDPSVAYAEPDRRVFTATIPGATTDRPEQLAQTAATASDPWAGSMWALRQLRAYEAWDTATGKGVNIGVVDTGLASHPDLDAKVINDYDFVSSTALSNDGDGRDADGRDPGTFASYGQCYAGSAATNSIWHGTHVAGSAAAARNTYGTVGIAPDAKIINARALGACGTGYVSDMAAAVYWLAGESVVGPGRIADRADVINMSLSMWGTCPPLLQDAINTAWDRGIPVAVAAGNNSTSTNPLPAMNYAPGNCYNVITTGAIANLGAYGQTNTGAGYPRAPYSNVGTAVDIYAPGDYIHSAGNTGTRGPVAANTRVDYGTSMATPHVAGTLALLKQKNPTLTAAQYKQAILDSGDPQASLGGAKTLNTHDALYITKPATTATPAAPAPGYTTKGAIGSLYTRLKGQTGAPTSNERSIAGGSYQTFAKGTIYWSSATGAYWVRGGVETAYQRHGTANGVLRFPRSDEKSNGIGGAYQLFQNGRILWGSAHGAFALEGTVDATYAALGSEKGALGYPTSDKLSNGAGGHYQRFQRGTILQGPRTGTHAVKGEIKNAYARKGSEHGSLGYPTAGETSDGTGGVQQTFQKGRIVWTAATGAHPLQGSIAGRHTQSGGTAGVLGYPTTDEASTGTGGAYQVFQKGRIYWSPTTYAQQIKGSIGSAYLALGGTKGRLGFPRTGEVSRADRSVVQYFEGGTITWRPGGSIRIDYR
ncbi:S8 family serine peptidase [Kocuria sp. KH4]